MPAALTAAAIWPAADEAADPLAGVGVSHGWLLVALHVTAMMLRFVIATAGDVALPFLLTTMLIVVEFSTSEGEIVKYTPPVLPSCDGTLATMSRAPSPVTSNTWVKPIGPSVGSPTILRSICVWSAKST